MSHYLGHSLSVTFTLCPLDGRAGGRGRGDEKEGCQPPSSVGVPALEWLSGSPEATYSWLVAPGRAPSGFSLGIRLVNQPTPVPGARGIRG